MTGKSIYRFVNDLIAYSLMLTLDNEGRWRQGIWSPELCETHLRAQVNGISLLAHYFKQTSCQKFISRSRDAMEYVVKLADPMVGNELWFVHDSLEQKQFRELSRYRSDFVLDAFSNSPWNSVCLNTHIWAIIGMYKFRDFTGDLTYDKYIDRGIKPLKRVIEARPLHMIYSMAYSLRDWLNRWFDSGRLNFIARNIACRYERLLRRNLLPYLKKKYPRINMPTGFIERDLTHSFLSDVYHVVTLRDLLMLHIYHPCDWLEKAIKISTKYSHESGFIKHFAKTDPRAVYFIDILILYSSMIDESYLQLVPQYLSYFDQMGYSVSASALSEMAVINDQFRISADNPELVVLTVRGGSKLIGVVVNPNMKSLKTGITVERFDKGDMKLDITDSMGHNVNLKGPVEVPGAGYLKFSNKEFKRI